MMANLFHNINDAAERVISFMDMCVCAGESVCVVWVHVSYVGLNYWATVRTNLKM